MLLHIQSKFVRLALRIYFTAIFIMINLVGDLCCGLAVKLQLLRGERAQISNMTGWLPAFDAVTTTYRMRKLPGGWRGPLMMLSGILASLSDFAVSALVVSENIPSRCPFGTGLVVSSVRRSTYLIAPRAGASYDVVTQAQLTSKTNGGAVGIYRKVNTDLTFRADEQDVLGGWNCQDQNQDVQFSADAKPGDIVSSLQLEGLLYNHTVPVREGTQWSNGSYNHIVTWGASRRNNETGRFDVRASIDLAALPTDPKVMKSFLCKMDAPEVDWVLSFLKPYSTLQNWGPGLGGVVYYGATTPASNDSGTAIEKYLNSMVMIVGGGNELLQTPDVNGKQGCLAPVTSISIVVIVLFVLVSIGAYAIIVYWTTLSSLARKHRKAHGDKAGYQHDVLEYTPNDLVDWMMHAAREKQFHHSTKDVFRISSESLKDQWSFGFNDIGLNPGLKRKKASSEVQQDADTEMVSLLDQRRSV